ncbi:MAG: hypothetical protein BroJett025_10590 [Patescibacteria group bacterium]|nr:MAG: hypothetical protein BroJett025_10590 [Patescibacteria group bacterium]
MFSVFFRTKLFFLLVIIAVVATLYYFGDPQKLTNTITEKLKSTPLAPAAEKFESLDAQKVTQGFQLGIQNAEAEISELSKRTTEVSQHAGNVLGSSVKAAPEENTTPIHEKAFEYGKYIYCKQVVTDYETLNPSLKEE